MQEHTPESYMQETLALAENGIAFGEIPIAAIVVLDGEIISKAVTAEAREQRLLVHAEFLALEQADKLKLSFEERLKSTLYTNLEPCLMCVGAAMSFYLGEIYYGLESPGDGAIDLVKSWVRKEADLSNYQLRTITGGILREESIKLFAKYIAKAPPGPIRDWAETLTKLQ